MNFVDEGSREEKAASLKATECYVWINGQAHPTVAFHLKRKDSFRFTPNEVTFDCSMLAAMSNMQRYFALGEHKD